MKKIFLIEGMHCASCARNIENAVKKLKEVKNAYVNFATKKLYVEAEHIDDKKIMKIVSDSGNYTAYPEEENGKIISSHDAEKHHKIDPEIREMSSAKKRMKFSWIFAAPLGLFMIYHMFFMPMDISKEIMMFIDIIYIFLAIPVIFIFGYKTQISALKSAKHFSFNMDSLIAIGTIAAFVTSWVIGQVEKFNPEDVAGGCNIYCEEVSLSIESIQALDPEESQCHEGYPFIGDITLKNKGKFTIWDLEGLGQNINFDDFPEGIKPGQEETIKFFFCRNNEENNVEIIPVINIEGEGKCSCDESSAVINDVVVDNIIEELE